MNSLFFPLSVSVDVVGLVIIMMIIPTATATDDPIQFVYADMGVRLFTPGIMIDDQGGSFFFTWSLSQPSRQRQQYPDRSTWAAGPRGITHVAPATGLLASTGR